MRSRQWLLTLVLILPGVFCFLFCMHYGLQDWDKLQAAYTNFDQIASASTALNALFIAEARQNIHRINLFADGVWALLGALVAAIGFHGVCVVRSGRI
jgi:hypothetical protein